MRSTLSPPGEGAGHPSTDVTPMVLFCPLSDFWSVSHKPKVKDGLMVAPLVLPYFGKSGTGFSETFLQNMFPLSLNMGLQLKF